MIKLNLPSPIVKKKFKGLEFLLKQDDLINPHLSGNKIRKVKYLLSNLPKENTIVSYGSIYSNAMYSLSFFAKSFGYNFIYIVKNLPKNKLQNPKGNLKLALKNGMKIVEGYEYINKYKNSENCFFIKEGVAQDFAYYGIKELAIELIDYLDNNKNYQIFLPSGTGTTALFLSKAIKELKAKNLKVYTTPVVGNKEYLIEQFLELESDKSFFPNIIDSKKKYYFGRLYKEFYQIWLELRKETNIEFDLLYDPKAWIVILQNKDIFKNLVYIHQGGILGNITMKDRYERKFNENNQH
jgi:1-aminocyclopropane-1-carboxylate deaminase/D-cysteine desulfhydrase-like pyridoxal-dependent ACC family enzyme